MISTQDITTINFSQQTSSISKLLEYSANGLKPEQCIDFLQEFGELIITTQNIDVFYQVLAKSKTSVEKNNEEIVREIVNVSPHENITERTEKSLTLEKVVMQLLKEGVDPYPNRSNKFKKNAVNLVSVNLGFSTRNYHHNNSIWRVTKEGKSIGCDNYGTGIIFSQRAYEEIKAYFLNRK